MKKTFLVIVVITTLLFAGCTGQNNTQPDNNGAANEGKELTKVIVSLDWTPNTNHTGLYVAKDKGYYEELGLDVEIIQPPSGGVEQLVAVDQIQFGVSYQEAVTFARLQDLPIVSIATIIQHNTSGFASVKSKGIETAADFEGKNYGGWGMPVEIATIEALMDDENADFTKVNILTTGSADFFATSESDVDFAWIFEGWTGIEAKLKGIELNYIELAAKDKALDYYTPVLITSEDNIENKADIVEAFVVATKKGYEFAIDSPKEAGEILFANAPEIDIELIQASQLYLSDKYQAEAEAWGIQKKSVWENYTNWLYERELISDKIDVEAAFTNEFIK